MPWFAYPAGYDPANSGLLETHRIGSAELVLDHGKHAYYITVAPLLDWQEGNLPHSLWGGEDGWNAEDLYEALKLAESRGLEALDEEDEILEDGSLRVWLSSASA